MKRRVIMLLCGCMAAGFMSGCGMNMAGGFPQSAADGVKNGADGRIDTVEAATAEGGTDDSASQAANADSITVQGTGTVTVTPDVAQISLGVQTADTSTKAVQSQNAKTVNAVVAAVKKAGVEEKNITTSGLDIYANYDYSDSGQGTLTGYTATTMLTVSNLAVSDVGDLIDAATGAGANQVNGISYSYSDSVTAYDKAMEAALDRAEEKAQKIAEKEGKKLAGIRKIEENGTSYDTPVDSKTSTAAAGAEDTSINVLAGETQVSAEVTVTYSFR